MVEGRRRKPLVLSSTKTLINSVLSSSPLNYGHKLTGDDVSPSLQLTAGILRFSKDNIDIWDSKLASYDDSALVGLSTSLLKKLSITSGSLVNFTLNNYNVFQIFFFQYYLMGFKKKKRNLSYKNCGLLCLTSSIELQHYY